LYAKKKQPDQEPIKASGRAVFERFTPYAALEDAGPAMVFAEDHLEYRVAALPSFFMLSLFAERPCQLPLA
jgi:hypothetical protein